MAKLDEQKLKKMSREDLQGELDQQEAKLKEEREKRKEIKEKRNGGIGRMLISAVIIGAGYAILQYLGPIVFTFASAAQISAVLVPSAIGGFAIANSGLFTEQFNLWSNRGNINNAKEDIEMIKNIMGNKEDAENTESKSNIKSNSPIKTVDSGANDNSLNDLKTTLLDAMNKVNVTVDELAKDVKKLEGRVANVEKGDRVNSDAQEKNENKLRKVNSMREAKSDFLKDERELKPSTNKKN